jgi:hypothetical protein
MAQLDPYPLKGRIDYSFTGFFIKNGSPGIWDLFLPAPPFLEIVREDWDEKEIIISF